MVPSDFNWTTYLILNPDVARVDCCQKSAQSHWITHGQKEQRSYHSQEVKFNWKFYTSYYPDLEHIPSEEAALRHYIHYGIKEGRLMDESLVLSAHLKSLHQPSLAPNSSSATAKVILFMNARDEDNLEEWVAYHLLLGFDRIIIFDHLSRIPIATIFQKYDLPQLEIHRVNDERANKLMLMHRAYQIANAKEITWLLYLDADEYLVLRQHNHIHQFIQDYQSFNAIGINWIMFGSNYHDTNPSPFVIDNFTRCSRDSKANQHVKTLVRLSAIHPSNPVSNPHYWMLKPGLTMHTTQKTPMPIGPFNSSTQGLKDPAYIHHYHHQSYQMYIRRKTMRTQDDTTGPRPYLTKEQFHALLNDHIETFLLDQYSTQIKQFLDQHRVKA